MSYSNITEGEQRFLIRLVKMYGEDMAKMFFKQRVKKDPPTKIDMPKKELPNIDLNLF